MTVTHPEAKTGFWKHTDNCLLYIMRIITNSTATRQLSGNKAQMNATVRHGKTKPQPSTIKIPKLYDINAIVHITPRTDGSLISLT